MWDLSEYTSSEAKKQPVDGSLAKVGRSESRGHTTQTDSVEGEAARVPEATRQSVGQLGQSAFTNESKEKNWNCLLII